MPQRFADLAASGRWLDGWQTMVESAHAIAGAPPQDLIYPVNLALRFTPWQDIGASRGVTAAGKLGRDVTYHLRRLGCPNPNTSIGAGRH
jgi:hypothetical protein